MPNTVVPLWIVIAMRYKLWSSAGPYVDKAEAEETARIWNTWAQGAKHYKHIQIVQIEAKS